MVYVGTIDIAYMEHLGMEKISSQTPPALLHLNMLINVSLLSPENKHLDDFRKKRIKTNPNLVEPTKIWL